MMMCPKSDITGEEIPDDSQENKDVLLAQPKRRPRPSKAGFHTRRGVYLTAANVNAASGNN